MSEKKKLIKEIVKKWPGRPERETMRRLKRSSVEDLKVIVGSMDEFSSQFEKALKT